MDNQNQQDPFQNVSHPSQDAASEGIVINSILNKSMQIALYKAVIFKNALVTFIISIVLAVIGAVLIVLGIGFDRVVLLSFGVALVSICAVTLIFAIVLFNQKNVNNKAQSDDTRIRFTFMSDRLRVEATRPNFYTADTNYAYHLFDEIIETKTHFFLFVQKGASAEIVPKAAITTMPIAEFRKFLLYKCLAQFKKPRND